MRFSYFVHQYIKRMQRSLFSIKYDLHYRLSRFDTWINKHPLFQNCPCPKAYAIFFAPCYNSLVSIKYAMIFSQYNMLMFHIVFQTHSKTVGSYFPNIFSIKIPYPLVESCTKTWVMAPTILPFCSTGLPLTFVSIY